MPHVVAGSDCELGGNESNMIGESPRLSAATDENKSGWKSTASPSAKLLCHGGPEGSLEVSGLLPDDLLVFRGLW